MNTPKPVDAFSLPNPPMQATEQLRFARWLEWGARLGLLWLGLSFVLMATGVLPNAVAPAQLAQSWGLPLADYLQRTQAATGWAWLGHLNQGEGAGLAGIAWLATCAVPGLLALLPLFLSRKERVLAALCVAQVGVLALAASGWVGGGH